MVVSGFPHPIIRADGPEGQHHNSCVFVDTPAGVANLVADIEWLPVSPPSLYVDLEGVNLSRNGSVSVIQIYALPLDRTYVVDIHKLKNRAFSQPSYTGRTLKLILESPCIPKVFFDVRSDSDALYGHFGIDLAGVQDLQLMELATRTYSRRLVCGLAKCIERDAPMTMSEKYSWKLGKEMGRKLFAPDQGGTFEVWNERPLPAEIIQYCVQDVRYLARLWMEYSQRLTDIWAEIVKEEAKKRIDESHSEDFLTKGTCRTLAPAGWTELSANGGR